MLSSGVRWVGWGFPIPATSIVRVTTGEAFISYERGLSFRLQLLIICLLFSPLVIANLHSDEINRCSLHSCPKQKENQEPYSKIDLRKIIIYTTVSFNKIKGTTTQILGKICFHLSTFDFVTFSFHHITILPYFPRIPLFFIFFNKWYYLYFKAS